MFDMNGAMIEEIKAREILDSRGKPTVEVEVHIGSGDVGIAMIPSGASTGGKEACELRDKDEKRFLGQGVLKAVKHVVDDIADEVIGLDCREQRLIDSVMCDIDKTDDKSKLGANAILGVSIAIAKAAAAYSEMPLYRYLGGTNASILPVPMLNILNGGEHADNNVDIQEFMILPVSARNFKTAIRMGSEVYHNLKNYLKDKGKKEKRRLSTAVGDEGGFAPDLHSNEEAIEVIRESIKKAKYTPGVDILLGLDCAANSFFKKKSNGKNYYFESTKELMNSDELIDKYKSWLKEFPFIFSIEDPFQEEDYASWSKFKKEVGEKIQIVGDDIYVTNPILLAKGIEHECSNSILIKLNQIGTVTETLEVIEMAHRAGMTCVVSHRSGETEDTTIADLAVAVNSGQIKTGAPARSERVAKYNRIIRIEEELGVTGEYAGEEVFYYFTGKKKANVKKKK